MLPVILSLRESPLFEPIVMLTGQHPEMAKEVLDWAGISAAVDFGRDDDQPALNHLASRLTLRFEEYVEAKFSHNKNQLCLLVQGDTTSALSLALAAFHLHIPVLHVEAGLRSGDRHSPFPEEINRRIISALAGYHFAPTHDSAFNLIREQVLGESVFVTGNTSIDALRWAAERGEAFSDQRVEQACTEPGRVVAVTAHRRENWDGGLEQIAQAVDRLAEHYPLDWFVVPMHPNPRVKQAFYQNTSARDNLILTDAMPFEQFSRLLNRCHIAVSDSGGIQEEAPALNKPVLVTRDNTERVEGVEAGTLKLVGTATERIVAEAQVLMDDKSVYKKMSQSHNPYGDGRAAWRIRGCMEHLFHHLPLPSQYGPRLNRNLMNSASQAILLPAEG
jgi:UDP-N-acetylglucosamine 2-epimerase (non-hydrolysing)